MKENFSAVNIYVSVLLNSDLLATVRIDRSRTSVFHWSPHVTRSLFDEVCVCVCPIFYLTRLNSIQSIAAIVIIVFLLPINRVQPVVERRNFSVSTTGSGQDRGAWYSRNDNTDKDGPVTPKEMKISIIFPFVCLYFVSSVCSTSVSVEYSPSPSGRISTR